MITREFMLVRRPEGVPEASDFLSKTRALDDLEDGCVRVRTLLWGVDPGLRSRLSEEATYTASLKLGEVVTGFVVGEVIESGDSRFTVGQVVTGSWGWRELADVLPDAISLAPERNGLPLASLLGLLGIPGITAYFGMLDVGRVKASDRVLVTSAAGGVGSIASQIAKIKGAHVTGLAGGDEKCSWLRESLGLDATIDYRAEPDLDLALGRAFPEGIDLVFENVGNRLVDLAMKHMRTHGRLVICGQTEDYNLPPERRHGIRNTRNVVGQRLRLQGLLASDYLNRYEEARRDIRAWTAQGKLVTREDIEVGFERLPQALATLFDGSKFGRKLVAAA
jgi:NADPH:quinone reductase